MRLRRLLVLCPVFLLSAACQQAAWKAGASADDFKRDEQACRAESRDDQGALKSCLRGRGWIVADFAAPGADASDAVGEGAVSAVEMAPAAAPLPQPVSQQSDIPANSPAASASSTNFVATPLPTRAAPSDPLQRQSVQSWWKAGGQAVDFDRDANACLERLGDRHAPDYARRLYTRAMVACLRERGWYAGADPVYAPLR